MSGLPPARETERGSRALKMSEMATARTMVRTPDAERDAAVDPHVAAGGDVALGVVGDLVGAAVEGLHAAHEAQVDVVVDGRGAGEDRAGGDGHAGGQEETGDAGGQEDADAGGEDGDAEEDGAPGVQDRVEAGEDRAALGDALVVGGEDALPDVLADDEAGDVEEDPVQGAGEAVGAHVPVGRGDLVEQAGQAADAGAGEDEDRHEDEGDRVDDREGGAEDAGERSVVALDDLVDAEGAQAVELGGDEHAQGDEAHAERAADPDAGEAVAVALAGAANRDGAAGGEDGHAAEEHGEAEAASGDEVVLAVLGASHGPEADADHGGEVGHDDDVVEGVEAVHGGLLGRRAPGVPVRRCCWGADGAVAVGRGCVRG